MFSAYTSPSHIHRCLASRVVTGGPLGLSITSHVFAPSMGTRKNCVHSDVALRNSCGESKHKVMHVHFSAPQIMVTPVYRASCRVCGRRYGDIKYPTLGDFCMAAFAYLPFQANIEQCKYVHSELQAICKIWTVPGPKLTGVGDKGINADIFEENKSLELLLPVVTFSKQQHHTANVALLEKNATPGESKF